MKKYANFLVFLAIVALLLSSCGGGSKSSSSATVARDSVNVSVNAVIGDISPYGISHTSGQQILEQMYETFYHLNDLTGTYDPRLATSHSVSDDGLVWTFNLRKGVKFHNGDELKATDVAFSFNTMMGMASYLTAMEPVKSVAAVDDYTVNITLNYPFAPLVHQLRFAYIVNERAVRAIGVDGLLNQVCLAGTGPYYLVSYRPDVLIELHAFKDYYRGEAPISKINYKPFIDISTGLVAFENGELDFYSVPMANWDEIVSSNKFNTLLVAANHISYFCVNPYRGPLTDARVREAIALCVDRDALNLVSYEGLAEPAYKMFKENYVLGSPSPREGVQFRYNIDRAKQLLAEAGYPNGVNIGEIQTFGGGYYDKMATAFQAALRLAGMTATVSVLESNAALANMKSQNYDLFVVGWSCHFDYSFARSVFDYTDQALSKPLFAGVEELFVQGSIEVNTEKRKTIYKAIDDKVMGTYTLIPVFFKTIPYAWNKNLNIPAIGSSYYYIYTWSWNS